MPSTLPQTIYKAAPGARFNSRDAPIIGRRLEEIEQRADDGVLTPAVIVEDAADSESPLHRFFEWDHEAAAHAYRLVQARNLVNHLIVVVKVGEEEVETKGWHSVRIIAADDDDAEPQQVYASVGTVRNNRELRKQVVGNALRELGYWQDRYREYEELFPLVKAIDRNKPKAQRATAKAK